MPGGIDRQHIGLTRAEWRADFVVRHQIAFDAAGVEEHGQPAAAVVPQFFGEFQERQFDRIAGGIEQLDVPVAVAAAHRCREVQVKLQQVLRQDIARRDTPL